jgi:Phospholipase A2-like domain/Domain of unknown function (DUF5679)
MIYCVKCKRKTDTVGIYKTKTKTGKPITKGKCKICGTIKSKFEKKTGDGIVNWVMNKFGNVLPEMHLSLPKGVPSEYVPGGSFNNTGKYSFCGPFTKMNKRLAEGYKGVNDLDKKCFKHDIAYVKNKDTKTRNKDDDILALAAQKFVNDPNQPDHEKAKIVAASMAGKSYLGMGHNKKKS